MTALASHPPRVAVIGGGLAGLASACTLAARGYRVVLFESNDWIGGKAALHESQGYRFDMGPTILTVPRVLRRIFAEAGRDQATDLPLIMDLAGQFYFKPEGQGRVWLRCHWT